MLAFTFTGQETGSSEFTEFFFEFFFDIWTQLFPGSPEFFPSKLSKLSFGSKIYSHRLYSKVESQIVIISLDINVKYTLHAITGLEL